MLPESSLVTKTKQQLSERKFHRFYMHEKMQEKNLDAFCEAHEVG